MPFLVSLVKLHIFQIKRSLTLDQKRYHGREKNAIYFSEDY